MEKTYCVYMHINKINNKKYIGSCFYTNDSKLRRNVTGYSGSKTKGMERNVVWKKGRNTIKQV